MAASPSTAGSASVAVGPSAVGRAFAATGSSAAESDLAATGSSAAGRALVAAGPSAAVRACAAGVAFAAGMELTAAGKTSPTADSTTTARLRRGDVRSRAAPRLSGVGVISRRSPRTQRHACLVLESSTAARVDAGDRPHGCLQPPATPPCRPQGNVLQAFKARRGPTSMFGTTRASRDARVSAPRGRASALRVPRFQTPSSLQTPGYLGSQRQPSLSSQVIDSPSPALPFISWSASEQYSPGS